MQYIYEIKSPSFCFLLNYYLLDVLPNKILRLMNRQNKIIYVSSLIRNNVASHLHVSFYLNPKLVQTR